VNLQIDTERKETLQIIQSFAKKGRFCCIAATLISDEQVHEGKTIKCLQVFAVIT